MYATYDEFDDWGITDQWGNEASYSGDDWWGGSDTNITGNWGEPVSSTDWGLGNLFDNALSLTGNYYQAKNQFELQKLQAERERVSYNQQVPVYGNNNTDTLMYVGIGVVAVIGLIAVLK